MAFTPTQLEQTEDGGLLIVWSDGQQRRYRAGQLREKCPCATCREKQSAPPPPPTALPVLSTAEAQPLRVEGMRPVGNYAYAIKFSDGHGTGLYSMQLLRELGEEANE